MIERPEAVILVYSDFSCCSYCSGDADWREATHKTVPHRSINRSISSCGARFTAIRYGWGVAPNDAERAMLAEMRPDLVIV